MLKSNIEHEVLHFWGGSRWYSCMTEQNSLSVPYTGSGIEPGGNNFTVGIT